MKIELLRAMISIYLNKIVNAKLKSLHHEAARMFPFSRKAKSTSQAEIQKLVDKLDRHKILHFLKGNELY